ncbi:MAG: NAD(P)/FAD-dependent oxidoreductase [Roseiflexaceae bacterium]|nr:NAD(P)/FAD-dependent oxidoreductase [Roseiflexaceae bacterium]
MPQITYDLLVIGAGSAGSSASSAAARQGRRVAMVERDQLGGTCLNYGCDPTKALLHSAHLLNRARHADRAGLHIPNADADWSAIQRHVRQVVDHIRGGSEEQAQADLAKKGIDVLKGDARFLSASEVTVGDQIIHAERVIIATGSQSVIPDVAGLRETGFITNKQAIWLPTLPRRLAIIGGGPIGVEFAQLFGLIGVTVTVLEHGPALLAKDDRELADQLAVLLSNQGIRIMTDVTLQMVRRTDMGKCLTVRCGDQAEEELIVDEILVAVGYAPALESLNLKAAGVETGDDGIIVDRMLRTNLPHIWAAGDVRGGYQFTHVASDQGELAAYNAFAEQPQPFDDRVIPWVTYTDPELAHVGKTEQQLHDEGISYRVGRTLMSDVARAIANGETDGLVKLLVGDDGMILGGHILASKAGELLASVVLAMRAGLTVDVLAAMILPYPTMVEAVRWAAKAVR